MRRTRIRTNAVNGIRAALIASATAFVMQATIGLEPRSKPDSDLSISGPAITVALRDADVNLLKPCDHRGFSRRGCRPLSA